MGTAYPASKGNISPEHTQLFSPPLPQNDEEGDGDINSSAAAADNAGNNNNINKKLWLPLLKFQ